MALLIAGTMRLNNRGNLLQEAGGEEGSPRRDSGGPFVIGGEELALL